MAGCLLAEMLLGVPLVHTDARVVAITVSPKPLHPWQEQTLQAERVDRPVREAIAIQKKIHIAASSGKFENERLPLQKEAVSDYSPAPAEYRLPPYLTPPDGEVALDRLAFGLINDLLGLPTAAPHQGSLLKQRIMADEALKHAFFGGQFRVFQGSTQK